MITEETLEYLLRATGDALDVPAGGAERIIAAARPGSPRRVRPRTRWLFAGACAVLAVAGGAVALTGGPGGPGASPDVVGHRAFSVPSGMLAPVRVPAPASASAAKSASIGSASSSASVPINGLAQQGQPGVGAATITQRVVQTGSVTLVVAPAQVAATLDRVQTAAGGLGGYVQDSSSSPVGPDPNGTLTVRVPVAQFDTLVSAVQQLGKVASVQESGQNVTGQYVNLAAQIAALQVSRSAYLAILAKATTIGDILAVQQQVDSVQQQIDQLQGEQNVLADTSANATLTVDVGTSVGTVPRPSSGLRRAFDSAVHGFVAGFEDILAALGPLLLVLLCLGVLAGLGRLVWRLTRRQLV